jgi:hypothetical protein
MVWQVRRTWRAPRQVAGGAILQANPAGDQDRFDKTVTRQLAHPFCETHHLGKPGTLDAREWSPLATWLGTGEGE